MSNYYCPHCHKVAWKEPCNHCEHQEGEPGACERFDALVLKIQAEGHREYPESFDLSEKVCEAASV